MSQQLEYCPQGVEYVIAILNESTDFIVYDDADIDGIISGKKCRKFLDYFHKPYETYINSLRQHGFKFPREEWHKWRGKTVFFVDAGMKREELQELVDFGISIINIDHHDIEYDELIYYEGQSAKGVIINNNYKFEPKQFNFLSGAGVVYYTLANICNVFTQDDRALVGLTLLSDIRELSEPLAKQLLHETYTTKSPYLQYLVDITKPEKDWGFGEITLNRNYIEYTFNPKINALMRCNHNWEVIELFEGRYPHSEARMSAVRARQKETVKDIKRNLHVEEYSHLFFCTIPHDFEPFTGLDITTLVGLTASEFVNQGKTTILAVLDDYGKVVRGSLRGLAHDVNYLKTIRELNVRAEGHHGAFGILDFNNCNIEEFNERVKKAEEGYTERKYAGRLYETNNLSYFITTPFFAQMADYNNYVRDYERLYIRFTGSEEQVLRKTIGRKIDFTIDGVPVQAFDSELTVEEGLILPITERTNYKSLFLRKR